LEEGPIEVAEPAPTKTKASRKKTVEVVAEDDIAAAIAQAE
jgi:hypothetical protein